MNTQKEKKKEERKILIFSEMEALIYAEEAKLPSAIISIIAKSDKKLKFAKNDAIRQVFRMQFNDLERDTPFKGYIYKAPVQADMKGLKKFVDKIWETDITKIVVHCAAGISRSAAVAQAISDYKGMGYSFWNDGLHIPNRLVYRLCMNEFGLGKTEEEYQKLFAEVDPAVTQE